MRMRLAVFVLGLIWLSAGASLVAQNTSSVFGPSVKKGASSVEYRIAYNPDDEGIAQRIHYQYGVTDRWRLRGIFQFSGDENESMEFNNFRFEALYQFLKKTENGLASAVRLEMQIPDKDDYPYRFRVAPTASWDFAENWQARANFLVGREFGPDRDSGLTLEGRAQLSYAINNALKLAVDYFADLNNTPESGDFNDQDHQLGPLLKYKVFDDWSGFAGVLFGLSRSAPDVEYRFVLTYNF